MCCPMCNDMKRFSKKRIREAKRELQNGKTTRERAARAYDLWRLYDRLNTFWSRLQAWSLRKNPLVVAGAVREGGKPFTLAELGLKEIPKQAQAFLTQIEQEEKQRAEREEQRIEIDRLKRDVLYKERLIKDLQEELHKKERKKK